MARIGNSYSAYHRLRSFCALIGSGAVFSLVFSTMYFVLPDPTKEHTNTNIFNAMIVPEVRQVARDSLSIVKHLDDQMAKKPIQKPDSSAETSSVSDYGEFRHAAVSVDSIPCAKIGRDVLLEGGNAFDAAVASMYCNSVVNSQSMGLGGGFIMVIHLANGTKLALNARETAPAGAGKHMFKGNLNLTHYGPLSSGVPGFVAGTWALKQRLGNPKISWASLLQPSIDLCFNGITVNKHAEMFGYKVRKSMFRDIGLTEQFIDPKSRLPRKEGEIYVYPSLGNTLKRIAVNGAKEFYGGKTGQNLVKDIKAAGGIITIEDLKSYKVVWDDPVVYKLPNKDLTIITSPPPGSGAVTAAIVGIMDEFNPQPIDLYTPRLWHRFVEASKFGYARKTHLADWSYPKVSNDVHHLVEEITSQEWIKDIRSRIDDWQTFNDPGHYGAQYSVDEDHGTCHMNFLGPDGSAASVTASINLIYGCKFMSRSTGVIMNNQMDDFANPKIVSAYNLRPSPSNYIAPGKRPMSSISTTIVVDNEQRVRALVGASGGTKIISAVAQILLRVLYMGQNVKDAIEEPRVHHQLLPMELWYENGTSRWILDELGKLGHNLTVFAVGGSAVQAIVVDPHTGLKTANADYRKGGAVAGF